MFSIYPACFFKENNNYSVVFPDLNWLSTQGESIEDAMEKAVECLAGYLHTCKMDGDILPNPSPMSKISLNDIAKELEISTDDSFINMVSVDVDAYAKEHFYKSVRKSLTIPAWLNTAAMERGINFSQTLQEALLTKIQSK